VDIIPLIIDRLSENFPNNVIAQAFFASMIGAILTFIGALPALLGTRLSERVVDLGMGFSAGAMIVISFTGLIIPAIEISDFSIVAFSFIMGVIIIVLTDEFLPHEHLIKGFEGSKILKKRLRVAWLIAFAMTIHNLPEGAAVGAAIVRDIESGVVLAIAIGLQNMPEGLAVALPFSTIKKNVKTGLLLALFSGIVEPLIAVLTASLVFVAIYALPYALALAAGAMIYVVSHEIIPESHRYGHERLATLGLIIGFLVMLWLDTTFT